MTKSIYRSVNKANKASAKKAEKAEKQATVKTPKVKTEKTARVGKLLTPKTALDNVAIAVIKKIRADRSLFQRQTAESTSEGSVIVSYKGKINEATVSVGRVEKEGKASTPTIAKAFITVTPKEGAEVTITGPHAALAWKDLTKVYKGHSGAKKAEVSADAVAAASKALGL